MIPTTLETVLVCDLANIDYSGLTLPMFMIYDHPKDHPDHVVVRVWDIHGPTNIAWLAKTIEEARAAMPPDYRCFTRSETDDTAIVETWL